MTDKKIIIVIPAYNRMKFFREGISNIKKITDFEILIVDDGSEDDTFDLTAEIPGIKYIKHETHMGYGNSVVTAFQYAKDMGFDYMITIDTDNSGYQSDIKTMIENLKYEFDVISCSRILENYNYEQIPEKYIQDTLQITSALNEVTDLDITDPLSEVKAYKIDALCRMEFSETTHSILLQIWIQAAHLGMEVIEIPSASGDSFGKELDMYDDPLAENLAFVETEKYLYPKGKGLI